MFKIAQMYTNANEAHANKLNAANYYQSVLI